MYTAERERGDGQVTDTQELKNSSSSMIERSHEKKAVKYSNVWESVALVVVSCDDTITGTEEV